MGKVLISPGLGICSSHLGVLPMTLTQHMAPEVRGVLCCLRSDRLLFLPVKT